MTRTAWPEEGNLRTIGQFAVPPLPQTYHLPWPPSANTLFADVIGPRSGVTVGEVVRLVRAQGVGALRGLMIPRRVSTKKAKKYRESVAAIVLGQRKSIAPLRSRLAVTIELYPPTRAVRDVANFEKAVCDALSACYVWRDDSQIDDLRLVRRSVSKGGGVVVTIAEPED